MALGDGIRRNIAHVDPLERALLRDALIQLNRRAFLGSRTDPIPGGVTFWFKQDEIHQATHVHHGPEFLPWHREIVNRLEQMLRQINPQLSLHYWDWTQDPRSIPNANLGGGTAGTLNLFTPDFMGFGGTSPQPIGEPWLGAGYYDPQAGTPGHPDRDAVPPNPADPPKAVNRSVNGSPFSIAQDDAVLAKTDYADMRNETDGLERLHNGAHGFVNMGGPHISFRDPFVFLLHSNVDRLFARWQTDPAHPERLDPSSVYGSESNLDVVVEEVIQNLNHLVEPWSTGHSVDQFGVEHFTRPWAAPENQGFPKTYKHPSIVTPPLYDTNPVAIHELHLEQTGWAQTGLSAIVTNNPPAFPSATSSPLSAVVTPDGIRRIFYVGQDNHIRELRLEKTGWAQASLSAIVTNPPPAFPLATRGPVSGAVDSEEVRTPLDAFSAKVTSDGIPRIFYTGYPGV